MLGVFHTTSTGAQAILHRSRCTYHPGMCRLNLSFVATSNRCRRRTLLSLGQIRLGRRRWHCGLAELCSLLLPSLPRGSCMSHMLRHTTPPPCWSRRSCYPHRRRCLQLIIRNTIGLWSLRSQMGSLLLQCLSSRSTPAPSSPGRPTASSGQQCTP